MDRKPHFSVLLGNCQMGYTTDLDQTISVNGLDLLIDSQK